MPRRLSRRPLIALAALALPACADPSRAPTAPTADVAAAKGVAAADRVTAAARWNALTWTVIGRSAAGPLVSARTFALVAVAQYNAVIAAEDAKARGRHPSEAGAASGAAAAVLTALYPAEAAAVAAQLADDAAYFPRLPSERRADFGAGVAVGRAVAASVLAYAATDGSAAVWAGTFPTGPGLWSPAPAPARPVSPLWGEVRPWLMASGDQFRPAPPPAFGSPEFLAALAEVRQFADARTPEQLRIALFWHSGFGPGGPAGYFGSVAADLVARQHLDERKAARVFAVMHMAIMDASIGCYDAKYAYLYLRPSQADPGISTPVGLPNFPAYPSAHSCLSSAAVGVLAALFPSADAELRAMVEEAGLARIYAGLHYRFDVTAGRELGYAVAALALDLAPRGHRPIPLD